jgi:hypothetical protein
LIVVIPSNRRIELSYLEPLIECGARFIVVDDTDGAIAVDHPRFKVYNWRDRRRILGALDDYFPRRHGACRDFGFCLAWRESDPGEAIVALDDDCRVYREDFAAAREWSLSEAARPVATVSGDHLNILDLYSNSQAGLFHAAFRTARASTTRRPRLRKWTDAGCCFLSACGRVSSTSMRSIRSKAADTIFPTPSFGAGAFRLEDGPAIAAALEPNRRSNAKRPPGIRPEGRWRKLERRRELGRRLNRRWRFEP